MIGESVIGTYRDKNSINKIENYCKYTFYLDLDDKKSIHNFIKGMEEKNLFWNKL